MSSPLRTPALAKVAGRYQLLHPLGEGARGEVFEAVTPDQTRVAVKLLSDTASEKERDRFRREAGAAGALRDPGIVPVSDFGIDEASGMAFLVMPVFKGGSLDKLLAEQAPLMPEAAIAIAAHIASALAAAHTQGVIHRDIKPSNVLLSDMPGGTRALLCDFGMAKHQGSLDDLTRTGELLGTPMYMAPEQAVDAKRATERSDVWALGATLYHALGGAPPLHTVRTPHQWFRALTVSPIPSLHELAPWLDPSLVRVVHGMLLRDPAKRCPSARDALEALRALHASATAPIPSSNLRSLSPADREARQPTVELPTSWDELRLGLSGEDDADPDLGTRIDGRYELRRRIGEGGMGRVYEASAEDGTLVAVKLLHLDDSDSQPATRRLLREARSANAVESPNVVHVMEAGIDSKSARPYLVLELLRGPDLSQVVANHGALDPSVTACIFQQICEGLAVAHAQGLIHRDIKPSNIVLHETPGGTILPKVCDFGIAKRTPTAGDRTAQSLTATGGMLGSPLYMSPEQAVNPKNVSPRADIWSLCMSLYQALSGIHPWAECTTLGEVLSALYTKDVPPLQDAAPWIDPALAAVVHRGLRRDAKDRFETAADLAEALRPFARTEPMTKEHLRSADDDVRARLAPRASVKLITGREDRGATTDPGSRRSRSVWWFAAGLLVLGALGFLGARFASSPTAPAPAVASVTTPSIAASATKPQVVVARLRIIPPTATVRVDGVVTPAQDGFVTLKRPPGDVARVELEQEGRRLERAVAVASNGTLVPAVVELDTGETTARPPPVAVPAKTREPRPAATAKPPAAHSGGVAAPTTPRFEDKW